jgi:hypothetical protein
VATSIVTPAPVTGRAAVGAFAEVGLARIGVTRAGNPSVREGVGVLLLTGAVVEIAVATAVLRDGAGVGCAASPCAVRAGFGASTCRFRVASVPVITTTDPAATAGTNQPERRNRWPFLWLSALAGVATGSLIRPMIRS